LNNLSIYLRGADEALTGLVERSNLRSETRRALRPKRNNDD